MTANASGGSPRLCESCGREVAGEPLCPACGAVQPLPPGTGTFEVFGLRPTFFVDERALEARFRELNRRLHPDRFAQRGPRERRCSLEWTTAINGAWRTLQDPLRRAIELLKRQGIDVEKETGGMQLPAEFLEEVMELREGLAEGKASKDLGQVRGLVQQVAGRKAAVEGEVRAAMERWEQAADREALTRAAERVSVVKYYRRFEEEAEAIEMQALE